MSEGSKGDVDIPELTAKIERHLDWVMNQTTKIRREDVDEEYLTTDERMMVVLLQLKLRGMLPIARKLAASLEGRSEARLDRIHAGGGDGDTGSSTDTNVRQR